MIVTAGGLIALSVDTLREWRSNRVLAADLRRARAQDPPYSRVSSAAGNGRGRAGSVSGLPLPAFFRRVPIS